MKVLRDLLDQAEPLFHKGGRLEKFYALYEAADTFLYTPGRVTEGPTHVRDGIDLKRTMITVVAALVPCIFMAMWNTGYQVNWAMQQMGATTTGEWRGIIIDILGIGYNPGNPLANVFHGFLYFFPVFLVCNMVGGLWEGLFAMVRKHEINEGFLVTGMLFPLTLPPTIPLWQVAIGISFGVVIGKEVFGGTGKNFLNPALTGRAFLYFAYPVEITGDAVWVAVDGFTYATPLGAAAADGMTAVTDTVTWTQAFLGAIPGSMGETSTLACLIGAAILIATRVGSWQIIVSMTVATVVCAELLYAIGSDTNPMFQMNAAWHLVLGGYAFGCVYMATDPVSATMTPTGRWAYGALIGFMTVLIRVINPAFPEGVMLAILFGNVFAPAIDYVAIQANIKRRLARTAVSS
ncbi:MAG: NADH:ubiquinone reductase (Na(+)-transporting) subunit B [Gemmatimonadetes bacterium]|nr:NADH:ubiquinone reductase (Na(+)-transporting) subunit B [Gemmatimonadota bacterium]MYB68235.1 NADH:ubiquinone reductase (Na(+)-transporting) subunit B [Gemmatimonadota bacterium]